VALGVDSASNRNEYQEHFPWVKRGLVGKAETLPPSWDEYNKICDPHSPGNLGDVQACTRISLFLLVHFYSLI